MKIDTSGNQIYFKDFSSLMTQYLGDLQIINNNRFLFIGSIDSIETTNGLLTISDSLGNIINERTFQSSKYLILESGLVTKNKDIVAIGGRVKYFV